MLDELAGGILAWLIDMRGVAKIRNPVFLLVILTGLSGALVAETGLLENSPFLPSSVGGAAGASNAPLELRSVLKEGGEYEFSLYDAAKRQSTWVKLNETGHDFVVKAYDPASESVTVEQQSRTYKLTLREVKIIPLAVVAGPNPMGPGGGNNGQMVNRPGIQTMGGGPVPGMARGPNTVGPTPALTPEQLRNLEADINRRRELRRQAAAEFSRSNAAPTQAQQR